LDATGHKHLLGQLRDQGLDLNKPRLWVIDGSKALSSAIQSLCGEAAKVAALADPQDQARQ
jgi:hypothetical protein